jgi:hypothetical protein
MRRQLRPGATTFFLVSPGVDECRISVDLQASLSIHFGSRRLTCSHLLKDKISLPQNDELGELEMDLGLEEDVLEVIVPVRAGESSDLDACIQSESDPDTDNVLLES